MQVLLLVELQIRMYSFSSHLAFLQSHFFSHYKDATIGHQIIFNNVEFFSFSLSFQSRKGALNAK